MTQSSIQQQMNVIAQQGNPTYKHGGSSPWNLNTMTLCTRSFAFRVPLSLQPIHGIRPNGQNLMERTIVTDAGLEATHKILKPLQATKLSGPAKNHIHSSRSKPMLCLTESKSILLVAGSWFWTSVAHPLMWGDPSWLANTSESHCSKVHYRIPKSQPLAPNLSKFYPNPPTHSLFLQIQWSASPIYV
jgi:hypothetical protein